LKVLTYVPFDQVEKYFAEAALFVNTSAFEGFPNTFLQAMKYGVPVVSLKVDPDGMLARHGCGAVCDGDFDRLEREVSLLMSDRNRHLHASNCCRAYLERFHDKDILVPKYREVLLNL
jgi:glycosyltransferase involved in cell wall biosynthesis